jgi:NitT/TauT family transport system substrate-binding protein
MFKRVFALAAALLPLLAAPALAQQPVRIGTGFGIGFLPLMIADELDLIEKQGRAAGLNLRGEFQRFSGSAAMNDAILSGAVDAGGYGLPALLIAWDRARNTPSQIFAVAGITTQPLILLTNKAGVTGLAGFAAADKIAMPALVSPQMYVLQLAAERAFGAGQHDRLRANVVSLPHPDALAAIVSGGTEVAGYFSSAPFTQIALRDSKVRVVLSSADILGGPASFLVLGATRRYLQANPQMARVLNAALGEAADLIKREPRRAAEIYLKVEPSRTLDIDAIETLLKEMADDFGPTVRGAKVYADFMGRIGQLRNPPADWKDIADPVLHGTPGS